MKNNRYSPSYIKMNDKKSFLNLTENSENQQSLKAVEEVRF